jgi:hypothetical protein
VVAFVVLVPALIGLGLLLTHVLLPAGLALLFALLAVRSMAAAAAGRDRPVAPPPSTDSLPEVVL